MFIFHVLIIAYTIYEFQLFHGKIAHVIPIFYLPMNQMLVMMQKT